MLNSKNIFKRHLQPLDKFYLPYVNESYGMQGMQKLINDFVFETILDIGCGRGVHSEIFKKKGKNVTSIDYGNSVYFQSGKPKNAIVGDYMGYEPEEKFDSIWCCHVLEHQLNPNLFLKKIYNDLKEDGILAITVPPLKHTIVGGHVSLWNAGLLLYHLVHAGFDCKNAALLKYAYNITCIVQKKSIDNFPKLSFDTGDLDLLTSFMPDGLGEGFDGDIYELNWY